jgi:hypothetical protein
VHEPAVVVADGRRCVRFGCGAQALVLARAAPQRPCLRAIA